MEITDSSNREAGKLIIKVRNGEDIRIIAIHNDDLTLDELILMMQRVFRLSSADDVTLKYQDPDGDLVSLFDGVDLAHAVSYGGMLRLTMFVNDRQHINYGKLRVVRAELKQLRDSVTSMLDSLDLQLDDDGGATCSTSSGDDEATACSDNSDVEDDSLVTSIPDTKSFDPLNKDSDTSVKNIIPLHIQDIPKMSMKASQLRNANIGLKPTNQTTGVSNGDHFMKSAPAAQSNFAHVYPNQFNPVSASSAPNVTASSSAFRQQQQQQTPLGHPGSGQDAAAVGQYAPAANDAAPVDAVRPPGGDVGPYAPGGQSNIYGDVVGIADQFAPTGCPPATTIANQFPPPATASQVNVSSSQVNKYDGVTLPSFSNLTQGLPTPPATLPPAVAASNHFTPTTIANLFPPTTIANQFPPATISNQFPSAALSNQYSSATSSNLSSTSNVNNYRPYEPIAPPTSTYNSTSAYAAYGYPAPASSPGDAGVAAPPPSNVVAAAAVAPPPGNVGPPPMGGSMGGGNPFARVTGNNFSHYSQKNY